MTTAISGPDETEGIGNLAGRMISAEERNRDSFSKHCRAIEEELDFSQMPDNSIAADAGQILLLGRVAEAIAGETTDAGVVGAFLERVAKLEDLGYGASFQRDNGQFRLGAEYSSFAEPGASGAKFTAPPNMEAVFDGEALSRDLVWDVSPECLKFDPAKFKARAILAFPCVVRNRPRAVLLFADDRRTPSGLRILLPALREMVRVMRSRLEQLAFTREIAELNHTIGQRTEERTAAAALENTSDAVIITDASERVVAVNRAFCEVTGYGADEAIGKTPRMLQSGRHDAAFFAAMWNSIRESGRWKGEIWNRRKDGSAYPALLNMSVVRDETGAPTHYVGVLSDLTAMKASEARFHHLTHYDALTELPNRLLFRARVEHAIEQAAPLGNRLAVLLLGVDGFKHLNESLGHPSGDELLRLLSARLQTLTRGNNTVARRGGDEFAVLLEGVSNSESAGRAGWNMLEGIAKPFEVLGQQVFLTCSAGISIFPDDGTEFTTLLQCAEVALHRAKGSRKNKCQFYTHEMTERANKRFEMESELRTALRRKELVLHYQPQFSLADRVLTGVEALARWEHRVRGFISPDLFIPIAEETGLIESLGEWALGEACEQAVNWQADGLPPVRVAVNLSTRQIGNPGLIEMVASALHESGLEPDRLELEITEGFLMEQPETARETLQELKKLGVTLAIDDFGTGYSSLSYLKMYPVDKLKIDRSFVREVTSRSDDQAIARAIITLGHGLSLKLIAEGVETEAQGDFLRENLCDEVQGFLFGRPMAAADFGSFLLSRGPG